jgi:hypothetical protein
VCSSDLMLVICCPLISVAIVSAFLPQLNGYKERGVSTMSG